MGKKFIPIKMHQLPYKVYLDNLHKIYKCPKRTALPVPPFEKRTASRKASMDTTLEELSAISGKEDLC